MTTISIVTPSLNQGQFLREALESVHAQNYAQTEHLVLDGGSTDQTLPVLRSLTDDKAWAHLRWTSAPDNGQSDALNRGFAQAQGDLIGWLNADDRYRPGCFEHVIKAFEENPSVDIFYGDYTLINASGRLLQVRREIEFSRFVLLYHPVLYMATTTTFFRRRIFEECNWLNPELHYAMDYEFFIRLVDAGYRIRRIPHLLADFRLHPESKSCRMTETQLAETRGIMRTRSSITRVAFLGLIPQAAATLMRFTEKMLRGHYLVQYLAAPRDGD